MKKYNVGCLPIKVSDRLVGFITDRDIALDSASAEKHRHVREIMAEDVFYCNDNQDLKTIVKKMENLNIRRLPVLNDKDKLVGIISLSDLYKLNAA